MKARAVVPAGASYTVQAQNAEDEMNLYMLSLGIFFREEALPSSYFGVATSEIGARARFVLVYGLDRSRARGRFVRALAGGAVFEREPA